MVPDATGQVISLAELPPGRALRLRRVAAGLTQEDVAGALATTASRVSEAESARRYVPPSIRHLRERIAAHLADLEAAHAR